MDDQRRQQRKDRKTSRAQKKAERKAARAADDDGDGAPAGRRIAKLMRATDPQLPALRARLLEAESAFTAADLAAARRLLLALDDLLDAPAPEAALLVHQAAALLEGGLSRSAEVPTAPAALAPSSPPPPLAPAAPPAPPRPVLVPSFLREPAAGAGPVVGPGPVAAPAAVSPPPPVAVPAPVAPAAVAPPPAIAVPAPVAPAPVMAPPPSAIDDVDEETATSPLHKTLIDEAAPLTSPARLTSTAPSIPFQAGGAPRARGETPAGGLPFVAGGPRTDPLQRFPLGVYASVCAELQLFPQQAEGILRRYGLSDPALREAVDRGHKEKLAGDPALRRQFDELLARAHATLRSSR